MCYAIPGKLVEIKGDNNKQIGVLDYFGEKRNVLLDKEIKVDIGDYVYAQGGVLIHKIPDNEAKEILDFWKERFMELKKIDEKESKVDDIDADVDLLRILQKINTKQELSREELKTILNTKNPNEIKLIYQTADNTRQKEHGNACCVHGIVEFSNFCRNSCHYCGLRKDREMQRYRMTEEEIISAARDAVELGFKALVLQSGEDEWYDEEILTRIVREIRMMGVLVFLSIGVREKELFRKLYDSGARGVLLRFETSNKEIFERLRPNTSFDERIELIKYCKEMGYIIATGFLAGLPDETDGDIINNILLTKHFGADMHTFGPFIPVEDTPLEKNETMEMHGILKITALARFLDRRASIVSTTALETINKGSKREGLKAGANSLMINVTPEKFRKLYYLYPDRADKDKKIQNNIKETIELLYSLGRAPTDIGLKKDNR